MNLFDLHCDTATRLYEEHESLYENSFHVSLKNAEYLDKYAQVMAVWTDRRLDDAQGYERFFQVVNNLENEIALNSPKVEKIKNASDLTRLSDCSKIPFILAVEDARILQNDLSRLDVLYGCGVRVLTLNWYGITCIGGAHNTDVGLTAFGTKTVKKCFKLGIIPDISHCSFLGASQVIELAKQYNRPVIASHSDAFFVNPHTRNLRDSDFSDIVSLGGLVGINLCPSHLSSSEKADISDVIKHIEHYLSLGGEDSVAIGGDLDGTDLPNGFSGIADIYKIANEMQRLNYTSKLTEKIMYGNAYSFFTKHL